MKHCLLNLNMQKGPLEILQVLTQWVRGGAWHLAFPTSSQVMPELLVWGTLFEKQEIELDLEFDSLYL